MAFVLHRHIRARRQRKQERKQRQIIASLPKPEVPDYLFSLELGSSCSEEFAKALEDGICFE